MESLQANLRQIIASEVFVRNHTEQIGIYTEPQSWIFDFRRVLMQGKTANLIADIFYETFKTQYPFQLCSIEIAGVPLLTALMMKFYEKGHHDINAFFIRKSRKKTGLMRMVEGTIERDKKIILVDDIINTGSSFWRQIEVLEELGHKVDTVWSIMRFRDEEYYQRFANRGISVQSLFTLDDFARDLSLSNLRARTTPPPTMPFTPVWSFKSAGPSLGYVVQKSQPILDDTHIYMGSDNETFWSIRQEDGGVEWAFKVGPHVLKKSIFSSPGICNDLVIFGAYDGNVYGLDRHTGKKQWMFIEADYVGSSPAIGDDIGLVFIGLEFGLLHKQGGIVALDAQTGRKIWGDYTHPAYTHSSPLYIKKHRQVVIGSNDGGARLYDAHTGELLWKCTTFGGSGFNPAIHGGFGEGDIKGSFAYDEKRDFILFGSIDGFLYIVDRKTGHLVHHHKCQFGIWSTPYVYNDRAYVTSVDKHIYCIDLQTFSLIFAKNIDSTRIFSNPTIIDGRLYVGTNAARLHELDPESGDTLGYFQAIERITNTVIKNEKTGMFFLPTYANQLICLSRSKD